MPYDRKVTVRQVVSGRWTPLLHRRPPGRIRRMGGLMSTPRLRPGTPGNT
ncbi:hypothetical protein J2S47_003342 [Streptomyces griseoviridis]|jgi:hypothetical protein|uniref:Uncharacterized protein n=1 Tax=Streptomyces griseoviridis TaxID=45398 RepID=A0ABT9LGJ6_STRGD|nr:hypothetical protein [Streptomyces griseoviridis]